VRPEVSGRQRPQSVALLSLLRSHSRERGREREARRGAQAGVRLPTPHSLDQRLPPSSATSRSSLALASHQHSAHRFGFAQ
jgi:hypothetical protein